MKQLAKGAACAAAVVVLLGATGRADVPLERANGGGGRVESPGPVAGLLDPLEAPLRTPGPEACNVAGRTWTVREVKCAIRRVFPEHLEGQALRVAHCESRFNERAINRSSGAAGVFQFLPSTWRARWNPYRRKSPLNPVLNSKAALKLYRMSGWSPWTC